jgi:hypothetical protein
MAAYLTAAEAAARLESYGISADLTDGDLLVASHELDSEGGPFIGRRLGYEQERAFPRTVTPRGEAVSEGADPPDEILDAVSLLAHHATTDEGGAITSESVLDMSVTYASPKANRHTRQIASLIAPYQRKSGTRAGGSRYAYAPERALIDGYYD